MFRIMKGKGGYGFYMWNDTDGKFTQKLFDPSMTHAA